MLKVAMLSYLLRRGKCILLVQKHPRGATKTKWYVLYEYTNYFYSNPNFKFGMIASSHFCLSTWLAMCLYKLKSCLHLENLSPSFSWPSSSNEIAVEVQILRGNGRWWWSKWRELAWTQKSERGLEIWLQLNFFLKFTLQNTSSDDCLNFLSPW